MGDRRWTTTLEVRGMTCGACETRVGRSLRAVDGVAAVSVSARTGTARLRLEPGADPNRLRPALGAAVAAAGYTLGPAGTRTWLSRDRRVWADVVLGVAVVTVLGLVVAAAGAERWSSGAAERLADGGLAVAVVLGLVAGVSTCMALVGGLVLAVSARHAELHPDVGAAGRLRPHLVFNAGRVLGFAVGGAVLGLLGSAVRISAGTSALVVLVVSAAMVAVGLQLTGVSPRLAGWAVTLPPGLARRLGLDGAAGGRYGHTRTAALGATSFLLPCGFTQVVQLYAVSTGSPARAGLVMALFAVGTAPGLLGAGGLAAAARGRTAPRLLRVVGVAVLAFAAVNAAGAVTVLAPGLGVTASASTGAPGPAVTAVREGDVQVLRTVQVADGYEPARATVLAGVPVRWEIDSVAPSCASALHAPAMGLGTVLLDSGVNTLTFTPGTAGLLPYSCAMGMYTGVIEVVEP